MSLRPSCLAIICLALAASAHAQIPRTPEGKPDFQGVWSAAWITPLERPPEAPMLIVPSADVDSLFDTLWKRTFDRDGIGPLHSLDVRSLLRVAGEARSSLIIDPPDGKLPLVAAARARLGGGGPPAMGFDGPEQRGISERCLNDGNTVAPFLVLPAGNMKQIVQTRDHLTVLSETMGSLRIIPIGDANGQAAAGRGRWEGDVLVVETSGFAPNDRIRVGPTMRFPISPKSKITERFTRSPDEIVYRLTVEDPDLYTRPWTAETAFRRSDQRVYEWGCQEANYALVNMLMGARMAEQRASKQK